MSREEPTVDHLVARIAETVVERLELQKRVLGKTVTFNEAARMLGEVINEEIDAGAYISDAVCRKLVGLPDDLSGNEPEPPPPPPLPEETPS